MTAAQFVTVPEAATRKGVSRICIWQWIQQGHLPAQRIGRFWIIDVSDLDRVGPRPLGRPRKEHSCA